MSYDIITFGCRLNTYESEVIRDALAQTDTNGHTVVFNSCAVTKEAERQLRQAIRKTRKTTPDARIIVTGCAAQIDPARYGAMKEVDLVLGNEEKLKPESYGAIAPDREEKIQVNDIMSVTETAAHLISSFEGHTRAFVQVQNGCNHRCTFCIIPYGRGNSRSVPMGEIVTQVRKLVEAGYKEIVLTGVDISDYGSNLPGTPTLGQMMRRLLALVPDLPRLRLSSIDVAEVDEDILYLIAHEPRFMPYMHISLQAGDNMILKRMKRRHTREDVIAFCQKTRELRSGMTFGADIIAGFPTETDEMFLNTLQLVTEAGISFVHVFPYSEREGTPAAKMPQVDGAIRKERAARLRAAGKNVLHSVLTKKIGQTESVIMEKDGMARAEDFCAVKLNKDIPAGTILSVQFTGVGKGWLEAREV